MDVSLRIRAVSLLSILSLFFLVSCGNRFDLSKERGRQASIDDANFHLSHGDCAAAMAVIEPLYVSAYVDDEVRILKASAYGCFAGFNLLTMASNLAGASNYFKAMAKSLSNVAGDSTRSYLYQAIDVLTSAGTAMNANQRSASVNTYMVFIQMATVSALLRNYGSPAADGTQGAAIGYLNAPNNMSNIDGCAMASALAFMTDSYTSSTLADSDSAAAAAAFTAACGGNCSLVNKDRSACDGANAQSIAAGAIVSAIDASW
jgi:hypothetical protein